MAVVKMAKRNTRWNIKLEFARKTADKPASVCVYLYANGHKSRTLLPSVLWHCWLGHL